MKKSLLWTISILMILTLAFAVFSSKENTVKGASEKRFAGPSGRVLHRGTNGTVIWEVYENGHLLFKPMFLWGGTFGLIDNGLNPVTGKPSNKEWIKYKNKITSVSFKPGIKTSVNARGLFRELSKVTELDLNGLDTSETEDMQDMFYGMRSLTELDLSRAKNFEIIYS